MHSKTLAKRLILLAGIALLSAAGCGRIAVQYKYLDRQEMEEVPGYVYLTWQGDPCRSMTVNYQTLDATLLSLVRYGTTEDQLDRTVEGRRHQIEGLPDQRFIHVVELSGLEPGQRYFARIGEEGGLGLSFKFRTLPEEGGLRFVAGGDMEATCRAAHLLEAAAAHDPMFGVVGGDIAYANGEMKEYRDWDRWIANWEKYMVRKDGCLVPVIAAIGNHETNDFEGPPEVEAPFYFGYLAQGGQTNFMRRLGKQAGLIVLDSSHTASHESQAPWLEESLEACKDLPYTFAVYHVPLFPSHRDYDGSRATAGREHWMPLFDQYRLTAAFENHDHTFKRTHPLRAARRDPEGTVYFGDGSMGVPPRRARQKDAWYLAEASGTSHFWLVEVGGGGRHLPRLRLPRQRVSPLHRAVVRRPPSSLPAHHSG